MDKRVGNHIQPLLEKVPRQPGDCVMLSGALRAVLSFEGVESIAMAGSVAFDSEFLFHHEHDIDLQNPATVYDGHCWVEIDDWIVDLSLSRTATSMRSQRYVRLRQLIAQHFRAGAPIVGKRTVVENKLRLVYTAQQELPVEFCVRVFDGLASRLDSDV